MLNYFLAGFVPIYFLYWNMNASKTKPKQIWENSSFRVRKKNYHNLYRRTILAGSKQNEKRAVNEKL